MRLRLRQKLLSSNRQLTNYLGEIRRFDKADIMLNRLPVKLSPHQIGTQEMLAVCELRGCAPARLTVIGAIPASLEPGSELTPRLRRAMEEVCEALVAACRRSRGPGQGAGTPAAVADRSSPRAPLRTC
jgi:Ni,Fe-hydrogenase maturation factor